MIFKQIIDKQKLSIFIRDLSNDLNINLKYIIEELKSDLKEKEDYPAYLPPHLQLVVLTGLPGSGKSSLAIELKKGDLK